MGFLSNLFLDNGNAKVIARSIAMHYARLGSFEDVVQFYRRDFANQKSGDDDQAFKLAIALRAIDSNLIIDFCALGGLILWVDASPPNANYDHITSTFRGPLARNFRKLGIDPEVAGEEKLRKDFEDYFK